jgi:hypothetical protein
VEGKSDKIFVDAWAPRAFKDHAIVTHSHQGKGSLPKDPMAKSDPKRRGLLDQLPAKLRAFAESGDPQDSAVLVLIDADAENCIELKQQLLKMAEGLNPKPNVVFRIAVEETEAFYLGDLKALKLAYPEADMVKARKYAPDSICGTSELFGQIVHDGGLNKVTWAEKMGQIMAVVPHQNRSPSFRAFHAGIAKLTAASTSVPKRSTRKYRHVARTSKVRR